MSKLPFSIRDTFSKYFNLSERNYLLFFRTFYCLLCFLSSDLNSMLSFAFLHKLIELFLCLWYSFLSLTNLLLRIFFLSFYLTITANEISFFMKGASFVPINLLFNEVIVFTTDIPVSFKWFRSLSLTCTF